MMETAYESYLGIDVGKRSHRACAIDRTGRVLFNLPISNSGQEIDALLARVGGSCLVTVDQKRNIGLLVIRRAGLQGMDVAYLPGIAMSRAAALFPGDAKADERDAEVIARTALGVPGALRRIPMEDSRTEKLRRLSAQRAGPLVEGTHQKNRMCALLLESNHAFEASLGLGKAWMLSMPATFEGPWNTVDAGRRRFRTWMEKTPYANVEECEKAWCSLKVVTCMTEGQIEAEEHLVKLVAARIITIEEQAVGHFAAFDHHIEAG